MLEIKRSIGRGFAGTPGGLFDILTQLQNGMLPNSGETYYVSTHGNNTTGLSWENAFKTVNAAITASNAYIADSANTYKRNKILIDSGNSSLWHGYDESITTLPKQCDMIGVGSGINGKTTIMGTHTIAATSYDCHIYNIRFESDDGLAGAAPIVTVGGGCVGTEFWNCDFRTYDGDSSATIGIDLSPIHAYKIMNCRFYGNPVIPIGIKITGPQALHGEIIGNYISATTKGIQIAHGVTQDYGTLIKDNVITRSDPNSFAQLATGISIEDTASRTNTMIVHNWIAAVNAINYVGGSMQNKDKWCVIDNHIVEADTGLVETSEYEG